MYHVVRLLIISSALFYIPRTLHGTPLFQKTWHALNDKHALFQKSSSVLLSVTPLDRVSNRRTLLLRRARQYHNSYWDRFYVVCLAHQSCSDSRKIRDFKPWENSLIQSSRSFRGDVHFRSYDVGLANSILKSHFLGIFSRHQEAWFRVIPILFWFLSCSDRVNTTPYKLDENWFLPWICRWAKWSRSYCRVGDLDL